MPLTFEQRTTLSTLLIVLFPATNRRLEKLLLMNVGVVFKNVVNLQTDYESQIVQLLGKLEEKFVLRKFLEAVLKTFPGNETLRNAIPPIIEFLPSTEENPDEKVSMGLDFVRSKLANQSFRSAVDDMRGNLGTLKRSIFLLHAYKTLHDCLHHLQMLLGQFQLSGRNLDDRESKRAYRRCVTQIETLVINGRSAADKLADEGDSEVTATQVVETFWLDRLSEVVELSGSALNGGVGSVGGPGDPVTQSCRGIATILSTEPPRIESLLQAHAMALQLDKILNLFGIVAPLVEAGSDQPELMATAERALCQLDLRVRALVQLHHTWQKVDIDMAEAERRLDENLQSGDFPALWFRIKESFDLLIDTDLEGDLATSLQTYQEAIEEAREAGGEELLSAFEELRDYSIVQFFIVDTQLKQGCEEIRSIGDSLRDLLN